MAKIPSEVTYRLMFHSRALCAMLPDAQCYRTPLYMQSFTKIKTSQNGDITLPFTDVSNSCSSPEFLTMQICLFKLFEKIKKPMKISEFTVQ